MLPSLCPRAHSLRVACPWVSPWPHSHCRSRTYLRIVTLETTSTWNPRQMLCCHRILPTKGRGEATWTPYQTTPNQTMPLSTEVLAYRLWRGHVVTWQPSSRQPEGNTLLKPHPWLSPHWGCGADWNLEEKREERVEREERRKISPAFTNDGSQRFWRREQKKNEVFFLELWLGGF